jgi:hypothetical protein
MFKVNKIPAMVIVVHAVGGGHALCWIQASAAGMSAGERILIKHDDFIEFKAEAQENWTALSMEDVMQLIKSCPVCKAPPKELDVRDNVQ